MTGGHEGVGTILALGTDCEDEGFIIGDTVGIAWRSFVCGICEACVVGEENHCMHQQITGMHRHGTYQCRYLISQFRGAEVIYNSSGFLNFPVARLVRVPAGLELPSVCPILCAGVTAYTSLRLLGPKPGKWFVTVGAAGGLGHLAIQYAKMMNLKVLGIDGGLPQN